MSKIIYSDKDKDSGSTPTNQWTDSDANEVKTSVNVLYDGSDKAWINCYKVSTTGSQTVANGTDYVPISRGNILLFNYQNVPSQFVEGSTTLVRDTICLNAGKYLLNFNCDVLTTEITTLLVSVFQSTDDVMNPVGIYGTTVTFVDLPTVGKTAHVGINAIIEIPVGVEGIQLGMQHSFGSPLSISFKKATKLTLLYLGI
jgi:hypothetical protein